MITLPACYTKTQATRRFCERKRECCQNNSWIWVLSIPCGLARMQLMLYLATNIMPLILTNITQTFTAQIITQKFVLHMRWQTYSRYFQILCYNNQAVSKFQVMNFLYITLLTLRVLKWPQGFCKICGPHPLCVHFIPPFRRTCETTCLFLWRVLFAVLKVFETFNFL